MLIKTAYRTFIPGSPGRDFVLASLTCPGNHDPIGPNPPNDGSSGDDPGVCQRSLVCQPNDSLEAGAPDCIWVWEEVCP